MDKYDAVHNTYSHNIYEDATWIELYPWLYAQARHFVYLLRISCWYGQEEDMVDDVVQETIRRIIERTHKAERGEATPIHALKAMILVTVQNYIRDLRRHDKRLTRSIADDGSNIIRDDLFDQMNIVALATENVSSELLFQCLARIIASFPTKRRTVLLMDLANRMCFDDEPTPLQAAFLAVGIDLQAYQEPVPVNAAERSRYASLLCLAYASLEQLASIQEDTLVA